MQPYRDAAREYPPQLQKDGQYRGLSQQQQEGAPQALLDEHQDQQQQQQQRSYRQRHLKLEPEAQAQQLQHDEEHVSSKGKAKELPHEQQQEDQQQQQQGEREKLRHSLRQDQQAPTGKLRSTESERSRGRGGFCHRRSRRIASVRFDVPPSPSSDARADPFVHPVAIPSPAHSAALAASAASSVPDAKSAEVTVAADAGSCSPGSLPRHVLPFMATAETTAAEDAMAVSGAAREAGGAVEGRTAAVGDGVEEDEWRSEAADTTTAGPAERQAAGSSAWGRQAYIHADCRASSVVPKDNRPPSSSVATGAVEPSAVSFATAATRGKKKSRFRFSDESLQRPTPCHEASHAVFAADAGRHAPSAAERGTFLSTSKPGAGLSFADTSEPAAAAVLIAAAFPCAAAAAIERRAAAAAAPAARSYFAAADWQAGGDPSLCGQLQEKDGNLVGERWTSKRETANSFSKVSASSLSSTGVSDDEFCDEIKQHRSAASRRSRPRLSHAQQGDGFSAIANGGLSWLHQEKKEEGFSSGEGVAFLLGNAGGRASPSAAADPATAVRAAALEATVAIDAAAAAAYPPEQWAAGEVAAAALRRSKSHILASVTSTSRSSRSFFPTSHSTCAVAAASAGTPTPGTYSAATAGSAATRAAAVRRSVGDGSRSAAAAAAARRSIAPAVANGKAAHPHATSGEAIQTTEDALDYSSDWSAFRRATGRCSIINPGAAVCFIKTSAAAWSTVGGSSASASSSHHVLSRGSGAVDGQVRSSSGKGGGGGVAADALGVETVRRPQLPVTAKKGVTGLSAARRVYYLNAAAVRAAATADAAARYKEEREAAAAAGAAKQRKRRASATMLTRNGDTKRLLLPNTAAVEGRRASAAADCFSSSSSSFSSLQQQPRQRVPVADAARTAETASVPDGGTRNSTSSQLLNWWRSRCSQDQQQGQQQPGQQCSEALPHDRRRPYAQEQAQEMHPLPPRQQRWSIMLPVASSAESLSVESLTRNSSKEEATELERLLELEGQSLLRDKAERQALQKEDLEAIVCNIQQVKNFLVRKLRECEAALLATAKERDDIEMSLKTLRDSLQEKDQQREATVNQLEADNLEKTKDIKRLQQEVALLREGEAMQLQQIQQLQDEGVLLRADVHDRVAASALEQESLLNVVKQLDAEKGILQDHVQQLQQALAKSRQQLASALSRVDELEAFVPPQLCRESPRRSSSSSSSSSQASSAASPATSAGIAAVDSTRAGWWSASSESPQRQLQQRPRSQQQQKRRQQQQQQSGMLSAFKSLEVDGTSSSRCSPIRCKAVSRGVRASPGKNDSRVENLRRGSTAASLVLPPATLSSTLDLSYLLRRQQPQHQWQQEEEEVSQQQQRHQGRQLLQEQEQQPSSVNQRASSASALLHASVAGGAAVSGFSSPELTGLRRTEGDAVDGRKEIKETDRPRQKGEATRAAAAAPQIADCDRAATTDADATARIVKPATVARAADTSKEGDAAIFSERAPARGDILGRAEKIKGALTGGVSRVLQQLENVLTVEERLIVSESGVYTEEGICLHKECSFTPLSGGPYADFLQQKRKDPQEEPQQEEQQQQTKRLASQKNQQLKGTQGQEQQQSDDNRHADGTGDQQRTSSLKERDVVRRNESPGNANKRSGAEHLLGCGPSSSSSAIEQQRKQRKQASRAVAIGTEDLLVVLSEAEEDKVKDFKNNPLAPAALRRESTADLAPRRSTVGAANGEGEGGGSKTVVGHGGPPPQQGRTKAEGKPGVAFSGELSRSSSAASVSGTVRDAVCSVLQAVHQRAVEVYVHPSSVLPTVPAASTASSTANLSAHVGEGGSGCSTNAAEGVAADAATATGAEAAQRSTQQQQAKVVRARSSAWEQLLQRHREAQQMPLFGSTPYPAATMTSSSRHSSTSSSSGNTSSTAGGGEGELVARDSHNSSSSRKSSNTQEETTVFSKDGPPTSPADRKGTQAVTSALLVGAGQQTAVDEQPQQQYSHEQASQQQQQREGKCDEQSESVLSTNQKGEKTAQQKFELEEQQQQCVQKERAAGREHFAKNTFSRQKKAQTQHSEAQQQAHEGQRPPRDDIEVPPRRHREADECNCGKAAQAGAQGMDRQNEISATQQQTAPASAIVARDQQQGLEEREEQKLKRKPDTVCRQLVEAEVQEESGKQDLPGSPDIQAPEEKPQRLQIGQQQPTNEKQQQQQKIVEREGQQIFGRKQDADTSGQQQQMTGNRLENYEGDRVPQDASNLRGESCKQDAREERHEVKKHQDTARKTETGQREDVQHQSVKFAELQSEGAGDVVRRPTTPLQQQEASAQQQAYQREQIIQQAQDPAKPSEQGTAKQPQQETAEQRQQETAKQPPQETLAQPPQETVEQASQAVSRRRRQQETAQQQPRRQNTTQQRTRQQGRNGSTTRGRHRRR